MTKQYALAAIALILGTNIFSAQERTKKISLTNKAETKISVHAFTMESVKEGRWGVRFYDLANKDENYLNVEPATEVTIRAHNNGFEERRLRYEDFENGETYSITSKTTLEKFALKKQLVVKKQPGK